MIVYGQLMVRTHESQTAQDLLDEGIRAIKRKNTGTPGLVEISEDWGKVDLSRRYTVSPSLPKGHLFIEVKKE